MAAEIFQRTQTQVVGLFASDSGQLSCGGDSTVLVQQLSANYCQTISRVYEVGNTRQRSLVYHVGGRATGNLDIARMIGPASAMGMYYMKFGDVCNAKAQVLSVQLDQNRLLGRFARPAR